MYLGVYRLTHRIPCARMQQTGSLEKSLIMSNQQRPLRLNVGFIASQPTGTNRDFLFDYPLMQLGEDFNLENFSGEINISRTPQGLLVQGQFYGHLELECVRCLDQYKHRLEWSFTDLYAFDKRSVSESDLILPEDAHIDLEPLLRDYAIIEIPINPLCTRDCKGLCTYCGENLNNSDCGHQDPEPDSPFSTLKTLLDT
ncbi:DUF177 domain-containing protein [Candidatus Bathyarchaeota archaeon]|nr:DUF177 domain-containing protein [Candidatus Bathyarchaeota archaeon]